MADNLGGGVEPGVHLHATFPPAHRGLIGAIDLQLASGHSHAPPADIGEAVAAMLAEEPAGPAVLRLTLRFALPTALPKALDMIGDRHAAEADRVGLLQTLAATHHPECVGRLLDLISKDESPAVQVAVVSALQPYDDATVARTLLERYAHLSPDLKARVRSLLASRVFTIGRAG